MILTRVDALTVHLVVERFHRFLQFSQYVDNITKKIPTFIGFIKSVCRFGHSKVKNGSS